MARPYVSNILDLSVINAWKIHKGTFDVDISYRDYIMKLSEDLRKNYIDQARMHTDCLININSVF